MNKRKFEVYNNEAKSQSVTISVGPEAKQFKVSKERICNAADYFKSLFSGSFKEALDGEASFPEDDVEAWELLIQWIDHCLQSFITSPQHNDSDLKVLEKHVRLYCVAETYGMDDLMDHTIDTIRQGYKIKTHKPTLSVIEYAYEHTNEKSPLRGLMCAWFYLLTTDTDSNPDELSRVGTKNSDLLRDYFKLAQSKQSMPESIKEQDVGNLCIHHQHTLRGDKVCPNQNRSPHAVSENAKKVLAWIKLSSSSAYRSVNLKQLAKDLNLNEPDLMGYLLELKACRKITADILLSSITVKE